MKYKRIENYIKPVKIPERILIRGTDSLELAHTRAHTHTQHHIECITGKGQASPSSSSSSSVHLQLWSFSKSYSDGFKCEANWNWYAIERRIKEKTAFRFCLWHLTHHSRCTGPMHLLRLTHTSVHITTATAYQHMHTFKEWDAHKRLCVYSTDVLGNASVLFSCKLTGNFDLCIPKPWHTI